MTSKRAWWTAICSSSAAATPDASSRPKRPRLDPSLKVVIMEKAEIMRSGACSAGMDAINTYVPPDKTPEDLVRWSRAQVGGGPLREDLALSNARELNESVEDLERRGLPYPARRAGQRALPGQAGTFPSTANSSSRSRRKRPSRAGPTSTTAWPGPRCSWTGAAASAQWALGVRDGAFSLIFRAKATVIATGGAGTLYKSYTADSTDSGAQGSGCAPTAWARAMPWASGRGPS